MRIAVAGGGIAGLTSAVALADKGFHVDIYERSATLEEVGAGIQLSPNAVGILQRLGVFDRLRDAIVEPRAIEIVHAGNGRQIATIPLGEAVKKRHGAPYCLIHRGDLQMRLLDAVHTSNAIALNLDAPIRDAAVTAERAVFQVSDRREGADILVAADGIHSAIRTEYFGHPGPAPLGSTAWRATLPTNAVPDGIPTDATGLWLGPGAHMVHYPVKAGQHLNVVVIVANAPHHPEPPRQPFGSAAQRLIDAMPGWTPWPLCGVDAGRQWVRQRVALIGDAAHAMAPSVAQGGAMAIEDAWVLASALAANALDPPAALRSYEDKRCPRVEMVAREAARNLQVYGMRGVPALARNAALRALPAERLLSRMDWLFGWRPD